jgi:UDP-GlcNAc:undecaprenyl-phosphate GlcNAc-1-phosphate transferase
MEEMKSSVFDARWWLVFSAPIVSMLLIHVLLIVAARFGVPKAGRDNEASGLAAPAVYGLAVFLAFVLVVLANGRLPGHSWSLLVAMFIVVAIGVAADVTEIDFNYRLFAQLVAALIIVSGTTVHVTGFGDLFGSGNLILGKWSILATLLSAIGLMNAIRLTDTLDGLAGSLTAVSLLLLVGVAVSASQWRLGFEIAVLCGSVIGISLYNLNSRGKIYSRRLGSAGCVLAGMLLYWYAAQLASAPRPVVTPITMVWILAVPLLDMASQMFIRVLQRKSPLYADRQHWYLFLADAGYSSSQVVAVISLTSLALGIIGLQAASIGAPESLMFFLFLCLFGANLLALFYPQRFVRLAMCIWQPKDGGNATRRI